MNKFLHKDDFRLITFRVLKKEFDHIYQNVLKKTPDTYGSLYPQQTLIHWSRDWEYPWAILSSHVQAGDRVLDCGCGGSPLLLFLASLGCRAFGVDTETFQRRQWYSFAKHLVKKILHMPSHVKANNLWVMNKNPNDLGYPIRFFQESMDRMHFPSGYFDIVYCISVIEHLEERTAYRSMREMARVLKRGGRLVITVDHNGPQVNTKLAGAYKRLIAASGLKLMGPSDFTIPRKRDVPGTYHVLGFVLQK